MTTPSATGRLGCSSVSRFTEICRVCMSRGLKTELAYGLGNIPHRRVEQLPPGRTSLPLKQREEELAGTVRELKIARDQAMEASRTKSSFLANMSHELRTPLNAIIGLTELLCENAQRFGTEKAIDPLRRVLRAGRHLLNLINDILDLSKIEAGKLDLVFEEVNIQPLLEEIIGTAKPLAEQNRNQLFLEGTADDRYDPLRRYAASSNTAQHYRQRLQIYQGRLGPFAGFT